MQKVHELPNKSSRKHIRKYKFLHVKLLENKSSYINVETRDLAMSRRSEKQYAPMKD